MEMKNCLNCNNLFEKNPKDHKTHWVKRKFCSPKCSNYYNGILKKEPLEKRFWDKVVKRTPEECWPWIGVKDQHGYGVIHINGRYEGRIKAHRLSYKINNGELIDGLVIMHQCNNPNCVNPSHLKQGTQRENMKQCGRDGRVHANSLLNLRPGSKGFIGAGKYSNRELKNVFNK